MYDLCGGRCEYCGSNDLDRNAHHLPYRSQPGAKNDPDHLVWLCVRDHQYAHRIRNSTDEVRYEEFRYWYDQLPVHNLSKIRE